MDSKIRRALASKLNLVYKEISELLTSGMVIHSLCTAILWISDPVNGWGGSVQASTRTQSVASSQVNPEILILLNRIKHSWGQKQHKHAEASTMRPHCVRRSTRAAARPAARGFWLIKVSQLTMRVGQPMGQSPKSSVTVNWRELGQKTWRWANLFFARLAHVGL
jgi:hypothetical protein